MPEIPPAVSKEASPGVAEVTRPRFVRQIRQDGLPVEEDEGGSNEDPDENRHASHNYAEQVAPQLRPRVNPTRRRRPEHADEYRDGGPFRSDRKAREQAREYVIRDPAALSDTDCEEQRGEHEHARMDVGADDL